MTIASWLKSTIYILESSSIPTARLDAEVLLADELGEDRSWILAHPEFELTSAQVDTINPLIERRTGHEPLAYIRGKQEFYGREFIVSPDTLTPRPETETMVELLLQQIGDWRLETGDGLQMVDIGTGSGCIIITAALELPAILSHRSSISYLGLDISKSALKIAQRNAKNLNAKVQFKHFDLLADDLSSAFDLQSPICVFANLPYVPEDFKINTAATHEPDFAIFGGVDGLDYYRALFTQLGIIGRVTVFTESLPPQHVELEKIAKEAGFSLLATQDLIQSFRKS